MASKRLKIEKTYSQSSYTTIPDTITESATLIDWNLAAIPQGIGDQFRVGRSIQAKKLECKYDVAYSLIWEPTSDTEQQFQGQLNVYYILDRQPQGISPPQITDIWETTTTVEARDLLAFPNSANEDRFIFLKTRKHIFQGNPWYQFTVDGTTYHTVDYRVTEEFTLKIPKIMHYSSATPLSSTPNILIYAKTTAVDSGNLEGAMYVRTHSKLTYEDH